ncbi:hypothetical protein NDU88_003892 [Pleurodeles waltl]|uniref:Uncharacterized protein n=1 Tax=Pleurodeles waltl TaxID=8319 RepID=A0AAV7QEK0_PLEWA|nr:hypothetical protein NDU88_003892 [Pleurodeles waltl]
MLILSPKREPSIVRLEATPNKTLELHGFSEQELLETEARVVADYHRRTSNNSYPQDRPRRGLRRKTPTKLAIGCTLSAPGAAGTPSSTETPR